MNANGHWVLAGGGGGGSEGCTAPEVTTTKELYT